MTDKIQQALGGKKSFGAIFASWWVVLNYDFILIYLGGYDNLVELKSYYGCKIETKLHLFGCLGGVEEFWSLLWKIGLPLALTLLTMFLFSPIIRCLNEKYYSLVDDEYKNLRKKYIYETRELTRVINKHNKTIENQKIEISINTKIIEDITNIINASNHIKKGETVKETSDILKEISDILENQCVVNIV